jgi:hypothetical protein
MAARQFGAINPNFQWSQRTSSKHDRFDRSVAVQPQPFTQAMTKAPIADETGSETSCAVAIASGNNVESKIRPLRQLGDVGRNPSRLILAEQLGRLIR